MIDLKLIRSDSDHPDFLALVGLLDLDLAVRDGDLHAFFSQFNKLDKIKHVVLAYVDNQPLGCGAIRAYAPDSVEVKRMFVMPQYRGQGIAQAVLSELEKWARELGFEQCILETGLKQPEAIRLYQKSGYTLIPNYGPYEQVENSVCMKKMLP